MSPRQGNNGYGVIGEKSSSETNTTNHQFHRSTSDMDGKFSKLTAGSKVHHQAMFDGFQVPFAQWLPDQHYHTVSCPPPAASFNHRVPISQLFPRRGKSVEDCATSGTASPQTACTSVSKQLSSIATDGEWVSLECSSFPSPAGAWPDVTSEEIGDAKKKMISPRHPYPNKYPVEIEYHKSKRCAYYRLASKSGYKIKRIPGEPQDSLTFLGTDGDQTIKYYEKDLRRVCHCGMHRQIDESVAQAINDDVDGFEIHYSQKCKWKAYDDFKTGERVLIRLCKCYTPVAL